MDDTLSDHSVNIGIFGYGTVGSGVGKLLLENQKSIETKAGARIRTKTVVIKNPHKKRLYLDPSTLITTDPDCILKDPEIEVILELMGGISPAKEYILEAMARGKHVITANKELMANYGKILLETAAERKVDLYFEASVGGGIPIIHPLKESLAGNKIKKIIGIVNGTTNYILTRMSQEGMSLEEALGEAQQLGYAEADPRADIEGLDAAAKLAILSSIAFNARVVHKDVYTQGIMGISPIDIRYARELGYTIKLLAIGEDGEEGIMVRVHPTMISSNHVLASVGDAYNAIYVIGEPVGDVMFYGRGAGSGPTAGSVVGDLIDVLRNMSMGKSGRIGCTCFETKKILPIDEVESRYYIVMDVVDKPGVLAQIAGVFGRNIVSIESVIQKQREGRTDLVFILHQVKEKYVTRAIQELHDLEVVNKVLNCVRVEGPFIE